MRNNVTETQFKESLVEVRKAYRLLYLYQKRVRDLVIFIKDKWNLKLEAGMPWPLYHDTGNTKGKHVNIKHSPWVWLPMYYYDFFFLRKNEDGSTSIQVGIIIQSDTGFFDVSSEFKKPNINQFAPPEESETRIILAASNGNWDSEAIRKDKSFGKNKFVYPDNNKTIKDVKIIAKAYPLVNFFNEDSTEQTLKDFEEFCESKGIPNLKS